MTMWDLAALATAGGSVEAYLAAIYYLAGQAGPHGTPWKALRGWSEGSAVLRAHGGWEGGSATHGNVAAVYDLAVAFAGTGSVLADVERDNWMSGVASGVGTVTGEVTPLTPLAGIASAAGAALGTLLRTANLRTEPVGHGYAYGRLYRKVPMNYTPPVYDPRTRAVCPRCGVAHRDGMETRCRKCGLKAGGRG